jgi:hypothetical protein
MLVGTSYFTRDVAGYGRAIAADAPEPLSPPELEDCERAVRQTRLILDYARAAGFLEQPNQPRFPYRVRSMNTGSFRIVVEVAPIAAPIGFLALAYAVATFKPRVSAAREQFLLDAARARTERERLETEAFVRPAARLLRDAGPTRHDLERVPDYIDVFDEEGEELTEWEWPD